MGIGGRCRNIPENELYAESSLSAQQPNHLWFLSSYFLATPPSMLCALATVLRREPFVFIRVNSDFIDHLANAQGYGLTGKHSSNSLTDSAVSSNLLEANFLHTLRSLFCLFFFFFSSQTLIIHCTLSLGVPSPPRGSVVKPSIKPAVSSPLVVTSPPCRGGKAEAAEDHRGTFVQMFFA